MKQRLDFQVTTLLAATLLAHFTTGTASAQVPPNAAVPQPTQTPQPGQAGPMELAGVGAQPPYAVDYKGELTIRNDRTGTEISTKRIKILTPGAIQPLSQQQLQFIEGMQTLETVEAFTEKSDGRRIPVDPANIITRDAASGLQATYVPDLKQRTIIFPDVAVGDTLVMTNKTDILHRRVHRTVHLCRCFSAQPVPGVGRAHDRGSGRARSRGQGDGKRHDRQGRGCRRGPTPHHHGRSGTLSARGARRGLAARPRSGRDGLDLPLLRGARAGLRGGRVAQDRGHAGDQVAGRRDHRGTSRTIALRRSPSTPG